MGNCVATKFFVLYILIKLFFAAVMCLLYFVMPWLLHGCLLITSIVTSPTCVND